MASITASSPTFGKKLDSNTKDLEEWMVKLLNEFRRLRMGDTSPGEADVL